MGYDNWLQSGAYDSEDEEIYIEERIDELLSDGGDCDPDNLDNIVEALSEASNEDRVTLEDYIVQKAWDKFGLKVWSLSYEYMEKRAESIAQNEVSSGAHL
jgi:hypothetical protein